MARNPSIVLTYRDYAALPDDGRRYEIHDGELSVTPAPGLSHQAISQRLFDVLYHHVEAQQLGAIYCAPVDVILTDRSIVQPDIVFVDRSRLGVLHERGVEGAPTLAIEILSPFTTVIDRVRKHQLYARHGVPCYWIVDPEARAVEAYALRPDGYALVVRATGMEPVSPPPFEGLALIAGSLWPTRTPRDA